MAMKVLLYSDSQYHVTCNQCIQNSLLQHNFLVLCIDANYVFLTTIGCGPLPSILFCSPESQCLWGIYQAWRSSSSHHHEGLCSTTRSPATIILSITSNSMVYCAENGPVHAMAYIATVTGDISTSVIVIIP